MTLTVTGNDRNDVRMKLGFALPRADIYVRWRKSDFNDNYGRSENTGCLVDATAIVGEEVPRAFTRGADAVRYIASVIHKHDAEVKKRIAEKAKKECAKLQKARKIKA